MKNLTKLMAGSAVAVAMLFGTQVKAQTTKDSSPWRFGIGVEAGAPVGHAHDVSNFELGGTARLQYGADKGLAFTLTSGYYNFFGKQITNSTLETKSLGIVPVKIGLKAFFADNFYFSAEGGAGFETSNFGAIKGSTITSNNKNTKLILSPGLGYASSKWDIGARYENFSGQSNTYGLVGLRVAYGFGL